MKRNGWIGLTAIVVVAGGASAYVLTRGKEEMKFRTAKADRGNVTQRISATGTINALIQVPVGTQVSGVVTALHADFNSLVKKGQIIAEIDKTPWLTALKDAEAVRTGAEASLAYAKGDYARNKRIWEAKLLSDADLAIKETTLKTATTALESAKAKVEEAKTNLGYCTLKAPVDGVVISRVVDVGQTVAASFSTPNVFTIAQDLSKMKVQAAIDEADVGQVRVGQQAFFTVDAYPDKQFKGLVTEVQLNPIINQNVVTFNVIMEVTNEPRVTYVAEAEDAGGKVRQARMEAPGQGRAAQGPHGQAGSGRPSAGVPAGAHRPFGDPPGNHRSSGDPAGGRTAPGRQGGTGNFAAGESQVASIETATARYIPAGSLVYKGNLALFPGMTANCTIVTNRRQDALRVPAVALRFNPNAYLKATDKKPAGSGPTAGQVQRQSSVGAKGLVAKREDHVWVLENGKPKILPVKIGVTDGQYTEIGGEGVSEGLVVLTGIDDSGKKAQMPQSASPLGGGPGGPPRR